MEAYTNEEVAQSVWYCMKCGTGGHTLIHVREHENRHTDELTKGNCDDS